jgi:uncharacterized repeat protein (TIGR01451 family)
MRQMRRLLTAVLVLLGVVVVVPQFAGIASAHHSNISASVVCSGTVSWQATSWSTGLEGTNPDILVTMTVGTTTTVITHGAFNAANNYQFSGTFQWPGNANSVTISSKPVAKWANGVTGTTGSSTTVYKPKNCPGGPGVTPAVSCVNPTPGHGDGMAVLTLTNTAGTFGSPAVFTVYPIDQPAGVPTSYTVAPGGSTPVTFTPLADGSHTVKILVGQVDYSQTFTVSCDGSLPSVTSSAVTCVNGDGEVVVTMTNSGGTAVTFEYTEPNGTTYTPVTVAPDDFFAATFSGLDDGTYTVNVRVGQDQYPQAFTVDCDHSAPEASVDVTCDNASHDGSVTVTLDNPGTEEVTFTIVNPITSVPEDVVVGAGGTEYRTYTGLPDGPLTISVTADGQDLSQTFSVRCDVTFSVTAVCNSVDITGAVTGYWFRITNNEATDVSVTWTGGAATVPAGQSVDIQATTALLLLMNNGGVIAQAAATEATCGRTVIVSKALNGKPATDEVYTIRISRLVDATYQPELTFDINGNESKTIVLPSTLDPAGIAYKIEEINAGSASTTTITPDQLSLSGHLGETVSVVVTNNYASVEIDKQASTTTVVPGGQITYTLQAKNTGALTLNPVVIHDRLPALESFVSAQVAGGAGDCTLVETARPQLIRCVMADALAPEALTAMITLVVNVDPSVVPGSTLVNQAMVHGAYKEGTNILATPSALVAQTEAVDGPDLSCEPVVAGTVCDLSAKVPVSAVVPPLVASSPPVPPASSSGSEPIAVQLPRTGAGHIQEMLVIAFGGILLGGAMLIGRRRLGIR